MASPLTPRDPVDRLRRADAKRDSGIAVVAVFSFAAVFLAVVAVGLGWRAIDESKANATGGGGGGVATVSLSEFAVTPVSVGVGGSLQIVNDGSAVHNLAIEGTDLRVSDLGSGEQATLDLAGLAPGTYTMICEIAGHQSAGMEADLVITEGGSSEVAAGGGMDHSAHGGAMDYQKMTEDMVSTLTAFPAETAGKGNERLEPTEIRADGTKVFDLTMRIAPWEVEPGKVVDAWTFNGMVPAPLIDVEVGDAVEVRVRNDLPLATDVHWHGTKQAFEYDGVAPITQPLIEPGTSFTYVVATDRPSVAMYHPHAHGHMLLPDGMFGVVLVGDVPLPTNRTIGFEHVPSEVTIAQEIPMVLNDAGVIGYSLNGKSFPATEAYRGQVGDWILVHYYNEGTQIHPMHLHQFDQLVIAKDGLPLQAPYAADTINVAPGERYSVLVHLDKPGTWLWHCHIPPHVERSTGMFGMVTAIVVEDRTAAA